MLKFTGKSIYGAIAIGKACVFKKEQSTIRRFHIEDITAEKEKFELAKLKAVNELKNIHEKALNEVGASGAQIFEIHMMMLEDEDYNESINNIIQEQKLNVEYAISITANNFASMLSAMDNSYMKARAVDIKDISDRLLSCITNIKEKTNTLENNSIICADDLTPSETVLLDKEKIIAFVTAHGASNSHTAILARNMNIPAIIGVGDTFLQNISNGDHMAVDGYTGEIFISPDKDTINLLKEKKKKQDEKTELLKKLKGKDNVTLDGKSIKLYANIGGTDDIGAVLTNDAGGIGLFRSEFLYLERNTFPSEEEQFNAYKKVLVSMSGKPVIIRTLDIGADKKAEYFNLSHEENPALGYRAIRICLTRTDIFKTQLRALYRASMFGKLGIMFPMITSVEETEKILSICNEVKSELNNSHIPFSDNIEIGIMIETPAAALISDKLAPLVDFFSIGTNDLIQYTLACDRQNPLIESFCNTHHEAVMTLIKTTVDNAHKHGIWTGICGELASDLTLTKDFLHMGIDELSVSPPFILPLRDTVRNISLKK